MPKLLLLAGIGWCATTPLWLTLFKQKIVNTGISKETEILSYLENPDPEVWKYRRSAMRNILYNKNNYMWVRGDADLLFSKDSTLDNFIEYYEKLASDDYQYVGEFSNANSFLSNNFLTQIAPKLKEHFDIRVLMITRDPVRRSYSKTSADYRCKTQVNSDISDDWVNNNPGSRFKWRMLKKQFPTSISYWKHDLLLPKPRWSNFSYVEIYKKYSEHFPTHAVVMEDLWAGKTEQLENFLECKLDGLHRNCYYPEMGTKAPRYEELPDQWMSDLEDLTDEDYAYGKQHLQWIYDEWFEEFKTRPWN